MLYSVMDTSCVLRFILQVLMTACLILYLPADAYTYNKCSGCQSFPSKELGISILDVKRILIDETNDKIIVGARNCLVKLEPSLSSDQSKYKYAKLSPTDIRVEGCLASGEPKEVCQNYIRLLVFDNNKKIIACGTYAKSPRCWKFEATGPFTPASQDGVNGNTQSPSYPDQNVTGVVAEQPANKDYIFTGINLNSGTRSSTIYRKSISDSGHNKFLKTDDSELFLKDANFVSSYTSSDNFIYFFWREKAIEDQNLNIYSRVGRVCTYDTGGAYILKKRFTSFTKARLSCTVPGSVDFSYDHLQSTFKFINSESDVYIYGIFTTPETGPTASAVCAYSLKEIQTLFSTSKYLEEIKLKSSDFTSKAWKSVMPSPNVQDPGRPNCTASLETKKYVSETTEFAKGHSLLTDVVKPNGGKPLFIMQNVRFTQIAVDDVKTGSKNQSIQVVFLATDNGTVYKLAQGLSTGKNPRLVEQINVFKTPQPILTMKLYKKSLYIGSSSGVTKVPINRCSDFKTCRSCIEHKDPYCGWSNKICTTKDEAGQSPWVQDLVYGRYVSVCPEEPPFCTIKVISNRSSGDVSLECSGTGIPMPLVTEWQKDSQKIAVKLNGYQIKTSNSQHSQILHISKFGLKHLGEYQCIVQNNKGLQHSCNIPIRGTLPVIFSGFSKSQGQTYFWCKATGIPKPTVSIVKIIGGTSKLIQSDTVSVNQDHGNRMYYCIAKNTFGPSKSRNYTINERVIDVEIKIKEENWTDSLKDPKSRQYKHMSERVKKAIQSVYSHDTAFLDIANISFSKGSVNAEVSIRFGASPSDKDTNLLVDLQEAIKSGKIGSLKVQKTDVMSEYNKGPTQEYQGTEEGIDTGVFVVGILVAIVLSILVGFLMGIKCHRQAIHSCGSRQDTSIHEDKEIQNVKYMRSPTIEETRKYPDKSQTDVKLMERDSDAKEDDGDHHSTGSSGGRIVYVHMPERSTTPERNVLINGKIPQVH